MGKLEDLRVFVEVVDNRGIARAADSLNIAKSAVSRRLKLLEERYDTQLIDRRRGMWRVTAAGQELYQRAFRLLTEINEIESDFTDVRQSLAGPLSVSLPREFGLAFLKPALLEFVTRYPQIQLNVDFDDRFVDLDRENYDLAVRIAEQAEPGLIGHRLGCSSHGLYAGLRYAEKVDLPVDLTRLTQHPLLHYGAVRRAVWVFETDAGTRAVEFQPTLNSNNGQFLLEAAIDGLGITRLPDFIVADALAERSLVPVLPNICSKRLEISLIHSERRMINRRMRAFIDDISAACLSL